MRKSLHPPHLIEKNLFDKDEIIPNAAFPFCKYDGDDEDGTLLPEYGDRYCNAFQVIKQLGTVHNWHRGLKQWFSTLKAWRPTNDQWKHTFGPLYIFWTFLDYFRPGVARLFCLRAIFEKYFWVRASIFNKLLLYVKFLQSRKKFHHFFSAWSFLT